MAGSLSALRTGTIAVAGSNLPRLAGEEIRVIQSMPGTWERTITRTLGTSGSAIIHQIVQTAGWLSFGRIAPDRVAALVMRHAPKGGFSAQGCSMCRESMLLCNPGTAHFSYSKGAAAISWVFLPVEVVGNEWLLPVGRGSPIVERGSWLLRMEPNRLEALCNAIDDFNDAPHHRDYATVVGGSSDRYGESLIEALVAAVRSGALQPLPLTREANITAAAMDYIDDHGEQPIYVKELCSACGVRERTLQHAFKALLQVSPMLYLKLRRLHVVLEALLRANGDGSVKRAALEGGFRELGRFAAEYSRVFGENPSVTLKGPQWSR